MSRLAAIILAAGYSSRMGEFKPLVKVGDCSMLERTIRSIRDAGIVEVLVVTGHRAGDLSPLLTRLGVREIFNPNFETGMFSSVVAGVDALGVAIDGCFVLPCDLPDIRPSTIQRLRDAGERCGSTVIYPMSDGRRGHPPLLSRRILDDVATGADDSLRTLLSRYDKDAIDVEVQDTGIHLDVDTPTDLRAMRERVATIVGVTESVCPVCLRRIAARRVADGECVYLEKECPDHGAFRTVLWRGAPSYASWGAAARRPLRPLPGVAPVVRGCPFDCGLCEEHRQSTCCVVLEITQRCNLRCPFCFASASDRGPDPSLATIEEQCRALLAKAGHVNLQLSGGEPTVRADLAEIVRMALRVGFPFVQLNTNGLRLAEDPSLAVSLADAGLGCVFLQFDGVSDDVYQRTRGRALWALKLQAIENCRAARLGVVLVPTLVPGVNVQQIGDIIRFAADHMPHVRAVHFQPVSYFGRYPQAPADSDRITIPEVLREIAQQTDGRFAIEGFRPPSAENAYCSFQGKFFVEPDGQVRASTQPPADCCGNAALVQLGGASQQARRSVARQWAFPLDEAGPDPDSFDAFLAGRQRVLSISGMAFQDAWNLDLERLRDCFLHAHGESGALIPLCAYNLTSAGGGSLYREVSA